jgi:hypothetical protein
VTIRWLSFGSSARKAVVAAHIPEANSTVSSPPSSALILRSTERHVGFP